MKYRVALASFALALLVLALGGVARSDEIRHRFLCVDNNRNQLLHVNQRDPARDWSVKIPPGSRDLQLLAGDRVLVSHGNGAAEYELATGRRLDWMVDRYAQVQSAQRLENGHTILGAISATGLVLYELDPGGKEIGRLPLPRMKDLRLLRRLPNGHTLMTVSGPSRAIEVDAAGKVVWQATFPGKGYKASRLANGNTMVSTGGQVTLVELDPAGKIVFSVGGKTAHPGLGLDWFSGFDVLPNGNWVAANWLGHGKLGTGPHLVEFDRSNRLVWKWEDHKRAGAVTNLLMLDGEPVALRVENLTVLPSTGPLAMVKIRNLQQTPYQGTVTLKAPEGWRIAPTRRDVTLAPGETKRVPFNIERGLNRDANRYPFEVTAVGGGATVLGRQDVFCASAPYFKPMIDGDPAEWKDAIPVTSTTGGKRTTVSTYWNRKEFALLVAVEEDRLIAYDEKAGGAFDAVQVAIAPQGSVTGTSVAGTATRWEFLLVSTGSDGRGKCFQLAQPEMKLADAQAARKLGPLKYEKARVAVRRQGTITCYECAIPWQPMREAILPGEGREFCLSVLVHDPGGAGIRDLGDAVGLWPSERNRLAWSHWEGATWGSQPPWDNKLEWGLCASKY